MEDYRITFRPTSFIQDYGPRVDNGKERITSGTLTGTVHISGEGKEEDCLVEVKGGTQVFSPRTGYGIPNAMKKDAVNEAVKTMVETYYRALCKHDTFTWISA